MKTTIKYLALIPILVWNILLSAETDRNDTVDLNRTGSWIAFPFAFSSDDTGLAGGAGVIAEGVLQPQTTLVATLFTGEELDYTTNGMSDSGSFGGGLLSFSDFKIPYTNNRLYFSIWGASVFTPKDSFYIDGSNDSNIDDAWKSSGQSNFFYTTWSYVLPVGEGLDKPEAIYNLKDGFAMDREDYGNGVPFETGRTTVGIKTFYQDQEIDNWKDSDTWAGFASAPTWNTEGLRLFMLHDNTDFDLNPSRGYSFQLQYSKDFGTGDDLQSWDFIDFKYNKYFTLETFDFMQTYTKQDVLAFSFWTGYSPDWDTDSEIIPGIDTHRPPLWEGGRLGGFNRMRGYDSNRFSGKAVIYGTAEYRAILDYNPFQKNTSIGKWMPARIDWLQVVGFVEAGRVNDGYNSELLRDMRYDAGVSVRAMVADLPVRFDIAKGDEDTYMWVMIRQPFDF
jgi:hypothetical protein